MSVVSNIEVVSTTPKVSKTYLGSVDIIGYANCNYAGLHLRQFRIGRDSNDKFHLIYPSHFMSKKTGNMVEYKVFSPLDDQLHIELSQAILDAYFAKYGEPASDPFGEVAMTSGGIQINLNSFNYKKKR